MAVAQYEHALELAAWAGLRNNVRPERCSPEDLVIAQNVDIDDSKEMRTRLGFGQLVGGAMHSIWSTGRIALMVTAAGTTLTQLTGDYDFEDLRTDLTPGLPMSYTQAGGRIYYSNGVQTGCVDQGVSRSWGLTPPSTQPAAQAVPGTLLPGLYQWALTYRRGDGQESGSRVAGSIDLPAGGGISLTHAPVSADPDVTDKVIYFTKPNGTTLYRAGTIAAGATTFVYGSESPSFVPFTTQHLQPPPAGQLVSTLYGAYTLVARDNLLYPSEAYAPELFDLRKNFTFSARITLLMGLKGGVLVGTEADVAWLSGADPSKWELVGKLDYPAVLRAFCTVNMADLPNGGDDIGCLFATSKGICLCSPTGAVANITQDRYAYPIQPEGAMVAREHRGMIQAVCVMQGTETAGNAA